MSRYYVASWGSDLDPGTFEQPFETLAQALLVAVDGDEIVVGQGGDALELPTFNLTFDLTIMGQGRGDDSTLRFLTTNVFKVTGGAILTLVEVMFVDETVGGEPGITVDTLGAVEARRVGFYATYSSPIYVVSGDLSLDQITAVWRGCPEFSDFPAFTVEAGSCSIQNSIVAGFAVGLRRDAAVTFSSRATDWWCRSTVVPGPPGDYDAFVNPEFVSLALSGTALTPDLNLTLSPTSACIDRGVVDPVVTDYSGVAPDLGAWETVFENPVQYCSFYNMLFFLWLMAGGLQDVGGSLDQSRDNRSLLTCDDVTMRDKYGTIAGVYRPSSWMSADFRAFLQVLFDTFGQLPARSVLDHVVDALFGGVVPGGEQPYLELDYFWQRRWNLAPAPNIVVATPPSLNLAWDEFFFYRAGRWWRSNPETAFGVTASKTTWIYSDGTLDLDGFVVWKKIELAAADDVPFTIPFDAYILAVVTATTQIGDIRGCGFLGVDSYANALSEVFAGGEIVINAPGYFILPPGEGEVPVLLKRILPRIMSAHKNYYVELDAATVHPANPSSWQVGS